MTLSFSSVDDIQFLSSINPRDGTIINETVLCGSDLSKVDHITSTGKWFYTRTV